MLLICYILLIRFEKISNIIKQFKLSCSKLAAHFQSMEVLYCLLQFCSLLIGSSGSELKLLSIYWRVHGQHIRHGHCLWQPDSQWSHHDQYQVKNWVEDFLIFSDQKCAQAFWETWKRCTGLTQHAGDSFKEIQNRGNIWHTSLQAFGR